jgi:hypothetical protein
VRANLRSVWSLTRLVTARWLAVELAAGLIAICVVIVGVSVIITILLTRSVGAVVPVVVTLGSSSIWLARESWPIVQEAWNGFPGS